MNTELNNRHFGKWTFGQWRTFFEGKTPSDLPLDQQAIYDLLNMVECLASEEEVVRRFREMCKESLSDKPLLLLSLNDAIIPNLQQSRKASQPLDVTISEPDMIERLQNNEKPFGLMDDDMREAAVEIGKTEFTYYYYPAEGFEKISSRSINDPFNGGTAYQLRPDYEPIPEKSELEVVECIVEPCRNGWLKYKTLAGSRALTMAVEDPSFIGYKYAGGRVSPWPRILSDQYVQVLKPAEIPTHALFAKGE